MSRLRRESFLVGLGLLLICALGAYLRLYNLRSNPGWYPDEGSVLNVAWNLWHGRFQFFAIGGSMLVSARAPLFPAILAALFNIFGYDILVARVVTAVAGLLTIPLMFFCLRRTLGVYGALASATVYAFLPLAVLYSRWSFEYSLLMPLSVILLWSFLKLAETGKLRWMLLGAIVVGLSILTAWVSLGLLFCLIAVGLVVNRRALLWSVPVALAGPAAFMVFCYLQAPSAFMQDFALTLSRTEAPFFLQFIYAAGNYSIFVSSNYWFVISIIGMFLIRPRRLRALVILLFIVQLFFVLRFSGIGRLGIYRVLAIVPLMAISIHALLARGIEFLGHWLSEDLDALAARLDIQRWWPRLRIPLKTFVIPLFVWFIAVDVLAFTVLVEVVGTGGEYETGIGEVLAIPEADARAVIDYVNSNSVPQDVVVASPQLGWAMRASVVEFQQTLSYEGFSTDNYPTPVRRDRYLFDPGPDNAKYAVVDRMWREWGQQTIPGLGQLIDRVSTWPIAFRAGDFTVYRNPAR